MVGSVAGTKSKADKGEHKSVGVRVDQVAGMWGPCAWGTCRVWGRVGGERGKGLLDSTKPGEG